MPQKIVATIIIIGLVLSLNFNLFIFKPKEAKAIPVAEVAINVQANTLTMIKEFLLDTVGHAIVDTMIKVLTKKIMDWGLGRKSDANVPFAVIDWVEYFKEAAARGAAKFITDFAITEIEPEIKEVLSNLGLDTLPEDLGVYSQFARSTLEADLGTTRYQQFKDSGYSLSVGGWDAWFSLIKPQNNIFGQAIMAQQEKFKRMMEEKEAADKTTAVSGGYKNEEATVETDIEACKQACYDNAPGKTTEWLDACLAKCDMLPGMTIKTQLKNWGSTIHETMTKNLGKDMDRLVQVDEITELLGVLLSALINKTMTIGLGWFSSLTTKSKSDITRTKNKSTYSYQRAFKKEQTVEDIKDARSQTLSNILKAIQQLSRSLTSCKDDELVKYDEYTNYVADLFDTSVEALYVEIDGVDLKPDFQVLDPRFAPYTVFGYSWGQVPVIKFPDKCKNITNQLSLGDNATCKNIVSGLEPPAPVAGGACSQCMYDHDHMNCPPAPYPPRPYPAPGAAEPWTDAIHKQKDDFWWTCKSAYNQTLDRCEDCVKKVDEKCQQKDVADKEACISNVCNNYSGLNVITPPADGLDFYNKCLIEETKDACFTCLKEYFMPATYCEQTHDYVARSIIKYPVLVKKVRNNAPDHEIWLGPYDKIMADQGGEECDNNDEAESIDLAIICRILPDFAYNGQRICYVRCSQYGLTGQALIDALKDVSDFRPHGLDCGNLKLPIGGKETWAPINDGVFQNRSKCCGALWQHDKDKYAICVGAGSEAPIEPPPPATCGTGAPLTWEPWCFCPEGWRPLGQYRTRTGGLGAIGTSPGGDCDYHTFTNTNNNRTLLVYTNNDPWSDTYFIATSPCGETQPRVHNVDTIAPIGTVDGPAYPTDASAPATMLWNAIPHDDLPQTQYGQRPHEYWCVDPNQYGMQRNTEYYYGVFHNKWNDFSSVITICARCNNNDANYPYYNILDGNEDLNDQCYDKHPNTSWLENACQ